MAIRPIDMQIMVPRTAEMGKSQHSEINRHDVLQQQFSERLEKQTALNNNQVQDFDKTEKQLIDNDDSKKNKQKYEADKRKKRSKSDTDSDKKSDKKESIGMFDIRI